MGSLDGSQHLAMSALRDGECKLKFPIAEIIEAFDWESHFIVFQREDGGIISVNSSR